MISSLALALLATVTAAPAAIESPFGLVTSLANEKIYNNFVVYAKNDGSLWLGNSVDMQAPPLGTMSIEGRVQPFESNSLITADDGSLRVVSGAAASQFTVNSASHLQSANGTIAMSGCPSGDSFQVFAGKASCNGRIDFTLTAVTDNGTPFKEFDSKLDLKQNFCCLKSCFKCGGCFSHKRPSTCNGGCQPAPAPAPIPTPHHVPHVPAPCVEPVPIPTPEYTPCPSSAPISTPQPEHTHESCGCTGDVHEAPCTHSNTECNFCPKDKLCKLCGHIPCPKNILCSLCNVRPCACAPKHEAPCPPQEPAPCNQCHFKRCTCPSKAVCNRCHSNSCTCPPPPPPPPAPVHESVQCNSCGVSPCQCIGEKLACAKCHFCPCACVDKLKNLCPGKMLCDGCNQCN